MAKLMLKCKNCGKFFFSGITVENIESIELRNNVHVCPYCNNSVTYQKEDYIDESDIKESE